MKFLKEITTLDIDTYGSKSGVEIMGDDFIGFKFIGENALFWNGLLIQRDWEEVAEVMNSEALNGHGIPYTDYDSDRWNEGRENE